jgi:uncharacterized membrane protein
MWLGMGEIFKKFRTGGEISNSDLFMHLDKAVMLAVEGFILAVCIGIGYILIVPGVIMGALFIYALYFMAYKGTGIIDSIKLSSFTVNKNDLMAHIVVTLVIGLILSVGFSTVIGAVIAYPLCAGFMALMFEDVKGE